ncbi:hypothetical protein AB0395_33265 [Streptosporangium sp. NPDC051023]|uniref:hypothetical protein n=1 Tax=Streptosporangium sp. NPDC051023 TaxID=3155410 RepID=UPI00344D90E7
MTDDSRPHELPSVHSLSRSSDRSIVSLAAILGAILIVGSVGIIGIGSVIDDIIGGSSEDAIGGSIVGIGIGVGIGVGTFIAPGVARRKGAAVSLALAVWIGGRSRRWQAEDWQAALIESPRPIRYSLGLVVAATRMRLYDLGGGLVKAARWVLASNRRTWWPLGSLLVFAAVNIHLSQGWGSAFYTLPTIVAFHLGVEWLRHRWGIEVKPKRSVEGPEEQVNRT